MGASRYRATESFSTRRQGQDIRVNEGDLVAGNSPLRRDRPEAFEPAEFPDQATRIDPSEHTAEEVRKHLENATDAERAAVLDLERRGKRRKSVLEADGGERTERVEPEPAQEDTTA